MQILSSVITLVLSLIMILLFRQADKNSRSIEKAKKYGDRIKDEIEGFVTERTQNLREAAIELDAKLSQAIAAVNRLDSIYNDFMKKSDVLTARSSSIDTIEKTVSGAEQTIKTVMDMTALAEKNLARVSQESDFVDSLAKKITDARSELHTISKLIPEMQEGFRKQNQEHLQTISERLTDGFHSTINAFETRVTGAQKKSEELLEVTSIQLNDLYKKAFTEAGKKAQGLEEDVFAKLKEQTESRMQQYKAALDEQSALLEAEITAGISESKAAAQAFKQDWLEEAKKLESALHSQFSAAEIAFTQRITNLEKELDRTESDLQNTHRHLDARLTEFETGLNSRLEKTSAKAGQNLTALAQSADAKFAEYKKQADYYYTKFEKSITDIDKLAVEMEKTQESVKDRILQDFGKHTYAMQEKYNGFEKHFSERTVSLANRLQEITEQLTVLREESHAALSEKLHSFESEFLSELTRRSDSLSGDIQKLRNDVAERLTLMGSESESARKDLEDAYKQDLKTRLAQTAEEYKHHFAKFKDEVAALEHNVAKRIAASDEALLAYTGQFKNMIDQTKEKAHIYMKNELSGLKLDLQEAIRQQNLEVETATKEVKTWMETIKQESGGQVEAVKTDFEAWKTRIDQQLADTRTMVDDKITQFSGLTERAIESIGAKYTSHYKDFILRGDEAFKLMQQKINDLNAKMQSAEESFSAQVRTITESFTRDSEQLTNELDKKVNNATGEAAHSLDAIRETVHGLRTEVQETQHELFEKVRRDADRLTEIIDEIDKRQNAFIAQTRVFDRADELKADLEQNIEKLKSEVTRFEIYRNAMDDLNLQYEKVTHLEEEAMQKIARFMGERKNIEILENDFAKLTVLSDSMDKKIVELASANDDLQQYQVQIRRIEESINDVNTRYDRLEKKGVVLDQTVQSIDTAFEDLKSLEKDIKSVESKLHIIPPELQDIQEKVEYLVVNQEKADRARQQLDTIDELLSDLEVRIEKLHTAREWLAGTETRLQDISKNSENQLKLLADLLKVEKPANKPEGSSAIGTRENVLKLFRSGWNQDAIANALNLSPGEVQLILELAEK
ncbi:MAG: hypothetical protein P1P65_02670 [Treponema sp.]